MEIFRNKEKVVLATLSDTNELLIESEELKEKIKVIEKRKEDAKDNNGS